MVLRSRSATQQEIHAAVERGGELQQAQEIREGGAALESIHRGEVEPGLRGELAGAEVRLLARGAQADPDSLAQRAAR